MTPKTAIALMIFSTISFSKPISGHTLLDMQCSPIEHISEKAEIVLPCTLLTVNGKGIDDKYRDAAVRFRKESSGKIEGRVERIASIDCDTRAVMIGVDNDMDSVNTFVALSDSSKECFLKLVKH